MHYTVLIAMEDDGWHGGPGGLLNRINVGAGAAAHG